MHHESLWEQARHYRPAAKYGFDPPPELAHLRTLRSNDPATVARYQRELDAAIDGLGASGGGEAAERAVYWLALQLKTLAANHGQLEAAAHGVRAALGAVTDSGYQHVLCCNMAGVARRLGDLEGARAWLERCDPAPTLLDLDSELRSERAALALEAGDYEEVLRWTGAAEGDVPCEPASKQRLAARRVVALEQLGRHGEAETELRRLLDIMPATLLRSWLDSQTELAPLRRVWVRQSPAEAVGMRRPSGSKTAAMALVVGGLGMAGLLVGGWGLTQAHRDATWVPTTATVEDVSAREYQYDYQHVSGGAATGTGLRIDVHYAYDVDGRHYEGTRYSNHEAHDDYTDVADGQARFRELQRDGVVTVYYDPDDPSRAVILPSERTPALVVTALGAFGVLLAIGAVLWFRRRSAAYDRAVREAAADNGSVD